MSTTPSTSTAAATTTFKPRMRYLGAGRWLVESKSTPGLGRQCTTQRCSCPAGTYGKLCWHVRLARQASAWMSSYAPTAHLGPTPATPALPEAA
jgi:hypothetical protein